MEDTKIEYTLVVFNRDYTYWDWQKRAEPFQTRPQAVSPPTTELWSDPSLDTGLKGLCPLLYNISPIKNKLFHGDRVDEAGKLISSPYRETTEIGGILLIAEKTYGRVKDKLLYKCIPYEKNLPSFLVPYEDRAFGFLKMKQNKYITTNSKSI